MSIVMYGKDGTVTDILRGSADMPLDFERDVLVQPETHLAPPSQAKAASRK